MASGCGSNFQSIMEAQKTGHINHGKCVALISNKINSGAMTRAKIEKIPALFVDHTISQKHTDKAILEIIKKHKVDFIFLAGYLCKVSPDILKKLPVYNVHPALDLRKFGGLGMYGLNVHKAVIESGEKASGATIHQVNEIYDNGRILAQTPKIEIHHADTAEVLQYKITMEEWKLVPQFINKLCKAMDTKLDTFTMSTKKSPNVISH